MNLKAKETINKISDVEKWQSNPVSRVANYIFFIALAVYTFTIKNKQKLKKGIQV